tara:strand:+ start:304 stop:495 length:192 start_codon:yes stop_codon:yes gene_type:complete
MNTNPALNAYRKIKEQKEEPKKNKAGGLLTRSNAIKRVGKADPKEEVSMRVARYVNDIRNYNA